MLQHKCQACLLAMVQLAAISGTLSTETAPYFSVEPSDIYVRKGKSATLSCTVGGNPLPSVRWKRNGVALDLSGDSRRTIKPNGSLHFSQIIHSKDEKPDEGEYRCEAVSRVNYLDYKIVSRSAKLSVAGLSSKVTVTPDTVKVKFGGIARFFCSIKHSVPEAVVRWRKKGIEITTNGRFTLIPGGALQISNIKFTDQGNYECIAENEVIARSHTSGNSGNIVVLPDPGFLRPPRFVVEPVDTVAIAGSQVILECAAIGSPRPRVSWLHNGAPVVLGSAYSILGESNLKIGSVSVEQAGTYTCRAAGGQASKEAQAQLTVHYPPVFTKKPSNIHAHVDSNATFNCEADGMPTPTISWSKNGDAVENTDYTTVGDGFLVIEDLVVSDMGVYQCIAKNSLGDIQATAELSVYRKGMSLPVTSPTPSPTQSTTVGTTVASTTQTTTAKRQVPEMPENVIAWSISDSEIEVAWAPPSVTHGAILAYSIFFSLSGEGRVDIVNTSGANLRKRISDLKPDKKYSFNVYAINKHGAGAISERAEAKTYPSSLVPRKPMNLEAEAESESTIRVTWVAPENGSSSVSRYVIVYKEAGSNSQGLTDYTKQQTRVLRNLKTYTTYTISVFAENAMKVQGAAATVDATTMSGVPWETPKNFVLAPSSSGTGLIATWNPPDPKKVNGQITYYIIKYRKVGSKKENQTERIGAENLKYRIESLMPGTTYEAKIAAGTDSGLGDFTDDWVDETTNLTDCKESSPPGKPEITFVKAFSNMIAIKWAPPDNVGLICVTAYSLGWGELNPFQEEVTLPSDKVEYVIPGLKSKQRYVIKLSAANSHGPGEDRQLEIRTKRESGSQEPVKGLRALPQSPKVMQLTWKDTQVSISAPVVYHVYHSVRNQLKYCGNTTKKIIQCHGLKPYTKYTFYVRQNMEGVNATISNYTEEDKPSHPVDLTGNPDEKNFTILTLHWQPPVKPNGNIVLYRVYYSDSKKASDERWAAIEIPGSKFTQQISGLTPGKAYFFRMQAKTRKGWGPLSEVKEIPTLSASPSKSVPGGGNPATSVPPPGEAVADQQAAVGALKNKTLWIVIAAVAGITLIAIIIISVILCKKRSGDDIQRKPPTYKSVVQANGSAKKKHKEKKPPDLWINHTENLEMKPVESVNPAPDVTNTSTIPRSSHEMKPLDDSPIDHIVIDHERNSFLNGSEKDPDDLDDLPPPPVIDSKDEPYPEYIDSGNRTPTPPSSPTVSPYRSPRPTTPDHAYPSHPLTSTPRYHKVLPRAGSCDNTLGMTEPSPPQRSRSYDPDFPGVPVFPSYYPPSTLPKAKPKPPVAPADDIQLPPVGYASRKRPPNGYWTPPPKYDDIFARKSPPSSPPKNQDAVVADLDKEIAGLEGLMRDLNEITAVDL